MANGHGGPRTPAHPAAVSGPGKYSRRTDGGPAQVLSAAPDQAYGEQKAQLDAQRAAPMAGSAPLPPAAAPAPAGPGAQGGGQGAAIIPLDAPTARPNEPITAGTDIGPGPGAAALNLPTPPNPAQGTGQMTALLQQFSATDATGIMAQLAQKAQARNA